MQLPRNIVIIVIILLFGVNSCNKDISNYQGSGSNETTSSFEEKKNFEFLEPTNTNIENIGRDSTNQIINVNKQKEGPSFSIIEPVKEGDLVVRGSGPKGVPITLIDISDMGKILSETVIDETGNYQFKLHEPLIFGHSIGLKIGDLTNTNFNYEDFVYSDTYTDIPLIGIILAKTIVIK